MKRRGRVSSRGRGRRRWGRLAGQSGAASTSRPMAAPRLVEATVGPCVARLFVLPDADVRAWVVASADTARPTVVVLRERPAGRRVLGYYTRASSASPEARWVPLAS